MKLVLAAILIALPLCAAAQATTDTATKVPDAKKVEAKKPAPKKKVVAKKPAPAKPAAAPTQAAAPAKGKVYVNDPKAPTLRDKDGNAIATNPNAYDVSSATGKK